MYRTLITSPDQALIHLAFHCCMKDGNFQDEELDWLSETIVAKGINKTMNLKEEMVNYQFYYRTIKDEILYLDFLIDTIQPRHKLALFAFCAEMVYRDRIIALSEEVLLNKIADLLRVRDEENMAVQKLICELNEVERNNAF